MRYTMRVILLHLRHKIFKTHLFIFLWALSNCNVYTIEFNSGENKGRKLMQDFVMINLFEKPAKKNGNNYSCKHTILKEMVRKMLKED